jgi:isocitrate dehydrogenase kinase/phosphatase
MIKMEKQLEQEVKAAVQTVAKEILKDYDDRLERMNKLAEGNQALFEQLVQAYDIRIEEYQQRIEVILLELEEITDRLEDRSFVKLLLLKIIERERRYS